MAFGYKPQTPLVIRPGMTREFIDALAAHTTARPKNYWEDCATSRKSISHEDMLKLKRMARGEE